MSATHFFSRLCKGHAAALLAVFGLLQDPVGAQSGSSPGTRSLSDARRVLIIFSEGKDLPGNVLLEQAVRTALQNQSRKHVEFYTEHMDASRFSDEAHYRIFRDYIGAKYAGQEPDLLMIFMARDFTLAARLPAELFPEVPVVFITSSEMEPPVAVRRAAMAGIVQRLDVRGTINLIIHLQPETDRIVVIGGVADNDRKTLARIEEAAASLPGIQFDFWTNQPFGVWPGRVETLPKNTAILLSTVFADSDGKTVYLTHGAQILAPVASAPVYSLSPGVIGSGAVGGVMTSPQHLGERAAQLGLQLLKEQPQGPLGIEQSAGSVTMLDWRALKRWGINEKRLPQYCLVRNRPRSLWNDHPGLISGVLAVLIAQALTIAALLAQRSRRRRAEAEILRQRAELAHVARVSTMGQLASALAHEINQPLGAILRNAEAAELFLRSENPDLQELRAILADIRKDDQRAGGVIDRMRSLLKRRSLASTALDIRDLLEETIMLARSDARARHVKITLEAPGRLPMVMGEKIHLQQVVLNLILNGMDAMNERANGERQLFVRASASLDGQVEVSVSDSGSGIPAEKMARVFEPFFTTKPEGLGMGLAISRTIIEAHGGKISARNNQARGATFQFTLPANKN